MSITQWAARALSELAGPVASVPHGDYAVASAAALGLSVLAAVVAWAARDGSPARRHFAAAWRAAAAVGGSAALMALLSLAHGC